MQNATKTEKSSDQGTPGGTKKTLSAVKKPLSKAKALALAIKALQRQRQLIAIDAHVQEVYSINTPFALRCKKEYDQYLEAIKVLEIMKHDGAFY